MGSFVTLTVKGTVKKDFRRKSFLKVAYNGKWKATKTKTFREFGKLCNAESIPSATLYKKNSENTEKVLETKFDIATGYWQFTCRFNMEHTDLLNNFTSKVVPVLFEHVDLMKYQLENDSNVIDITERMNMGLINIKKSA